MVRSPATRIAQCTSACVVALRGHGPLTNKELQAITGYRSNRIHAALVVAPGVDRKQTVVGGNLKWVYVLRNPHNHEAVK